MLLATAVSLTVAPLAASAQGYPNQGYQQGGQDQGYGQQPPPDQGGYQQGGQDQGYGQQPPPDQGGYDDAQNGPPPGYNGSQPPPPPPGYQPPPDQASQGQDQAYASYAQNWAAQYCVKSQNNAAAGAVIGGILGAAIGAGVSHNAGGAAAGAIIGGSTGAVIGSNGGNETSPGCPPGYVVRGDAPSFYYNSPYSYAAPGWYQPWVFIGGRWAFRPYPYHTWYYHRYYPGGGGYGHHHHHY
ncbi:MAG TPA: hypothetical protein VGL58_07795 [Caulobacteraceae bacterium]